MQPSAPEIPEQTPVFLMETALDKRKFKKKLFFYTNKRNKDLIFLSNCSI